MRVRFAFAAAITSLITGVTTAAAAAPAAHAQASPPCSAGTEQALEFEGLPGRIVYGPPRIFAFADTFGDYMLDGLIHVTMADAATGRVFFEGDVDAYDDLYLQLDLDDDPVTVTATYDQSDPLAPEVGVCRQTLARTVRGYRRIVLPRQCLQGVYRPRTVIIACGDGNFQLRRLRWRGWNRATAKARGYAWVNDCVPYCAAGTFHRYRVRVRASRIRRCSHDDDRYRYTRLRITYPARRLGGIPRRATLAVPCFSVP
jgi:hypothetical protein